MHIDVKPLSKNGQLNTFRPFHTARLDYQRKQAFFQTHNITKMLKFLKNYKFRAKNVFCEVVQGKSYQQCYKQESSFKCTLNIFKFIKDLIFFQESFQKYVIDYFTPNKQGQFEQKRKGNYANKNDRFASGVLHRLSYHAFTTTPAQ